MKYNKGFAPILIALIVAGFIAVGGVAYYAGKSSKVVPDSVCNKDTTPNVKIISPNGGETFTLGQTIKINWTSKCISSDKLVLLSIGIKDSQAVSELLSKEVANTGSYDFTIPNNYNLSAYKSNKYNISISYIYGNGDAVNDQSDAPFTITDSDQSKTIGVKVYFIDKKDYKIEEGFGSVEAPNQAVVRYIPKTVEVARAAINELLKGPTTEETSLGFRTCISTGFPSHNLKISIKSLNIKNGVASIDFLLPKSIIPDTYDSFNTGAGICGTESVSSQIRNTLLQFPTIKSVLITVNGKPLGNSIVLPV